MVNRRLLRIKVFKVLFGRIYSGKESFQAAENELLLSCERTLDLYYFLMTLPMALKKAAQEKIETGLSKYHPTPEEASPNRKFVDNSLIAKLEDEKKLKDHCASKGMLWKDNPSFVKNLLKSVMSSDYYQEYMSSGNSSFAEDKKLLINIFRAELEDNEDLYGILEDMNIYWADDIAYVAGVIINNLTSLKENGYLVYPDVFIKEEDKQYALRLLTQSMFHYDDYVKEMSKYILNWEPDRLASTDTSLIVLGIAEAVAFPSIPLKVTINEYVEISKYYSTPNSKVFVNGILEKVLLGLQREGKIQKTGRGLAGSID